MQLTLFLSGSVCPNHWSFLRRQTSLQTRSPFSSRSIGIHRKENKWAAHSQWKSYRALYNTLSNYTTHTAYCICSRQYLQASKVYTISCRFSSLSSQLSRSLCVNAKGSSSLWFSRVQSISKISGKCVVYRPGTNFWRQQFFRYTV